MNQSVNSQVSQRIIGLVIEHQRKSKQGFLEVHLENIGGCKGQKMKLRLQVIYDGNRFSEIVSDCLSSDDLLEIHESVSEFLKKTIISKQ